MERKNKLIKVIGKFYDHFIGQTSEIYQELIFKKTDQQKVNLLMWQYYANKLSLVTFVSVCMSLFYLIW